MSIRRKKRKYFRSLNDLTTYKEQLKVEHTALQKDIMNSLFNPLNLGRAITAGTFNLLFKKRQKQQKGHLFTKDKKRNKWNWILSLSQLNSLSVLGLLKFFFRTVKKTSWFKWQFIFLTYTILRFFLKRKKETAKNL